MLCRENDITTLRAALEAVGMINRVSIPEGIDLDAELVGKPGIVASKDAADKGRLFCSCGNSLELVAIPRVGGKPGARFFLNSSFAVALEVRPVAAPYKGTDTYLTLALTG